MSDLSPEHEQIRKQTVKSADAPVDSAPMTDINPLSQLQRMIGNRAVQRLVTPSGQPIQTKMTVTASDDAYEAEADKVADQVVRKFQAPDVAQRDGEEEVMAKRIQREAEGGESEEEEVMAKRIQREAEGGESEEEEIMAKRIQREAEGGESEEEEIMAKRIQREAEGGESEEEEIMAKRIQREAEGGESEEEEIMAKRIQRSGDMMGSFNVGDDFEQSLSSARGGGKSIDSGAREKLEGAMGADFSGVRIHDSKQADSLSSSIQAKAFTTGSDIFFKSGAYNPGSSEGQKLLAHELTHTIQQGAVNTKRDEPKS